MYRLIAFFILCFLPNVHASLKIVTTTEDLKALVENIGRDKVEVISIAKGTQDPHQIEAKPSYMVKIRSADLVIAQGLELEAGWLTALLQGARNPKVIVGSKGYLELGKDLEPLEVSTGSLTRAAGDVHPGGNPHFQLDPIRLAKACELIAARLSELDSSTSAFYQKNALELKTLLEKKTLEWQERLRKTKITEVVTYHKTLTYFLERFNIKAALQLEPKPGIPPTASHLLSIIDEMKKRKIKVVLIENYFDQTAGEKLQQEIPGVRFFHVPVSVGGAPNIKTNASLIENLVSTLEQAGR